jgi:hypothetical protein
MCGFVTAFIARHYRELADREEQANKARMAESVERVRLQRQRAAPKAILPAVTNFLIAGLPNSGRVNRQRLIVGITHRAKGALQSRRFITLVGRRRSSSW